MKIFYLILCAFLFISCTSKEDENQSKQETKEIIQNIYPLKLNTNQGDITITKINRGLHFSDINSSAVLLNFFTTWCPSCQAEISVLNNLQEKYKNDLKIISVLMENKSKEQIDEFVNKNNIKYPISFGKNNYKLAQDLGKVNAIPFMILYDKNGHYKTHYIGAIIQEMLDTDIIKAIQ